MTGLRPVVLLSNSMVIHFLLEHRNYYYLIALQNTVLYLIYYKKSKLMCSTGHHNQLHNRHLMTIIEKEIKHKLKTN